MGHRLDLHDLVGSEVEFLHRARQGPHRLHRPHLVVGRVELRDHLEITERRQLLDVVVIQHELQQPARGAHLVQRLDVCQQVLPEANLLQPPKVEYPPVHLLQPVLRQVDLLHVIANRDLREVGKLPPAEVEHMISFLLVSHRLPKP